jgi:hypothetical protein
MNKKGSHIGFILSFAIFITFIVFLFVVFNPIVNFRQDKSISLNQLENGLLERFDLDGITLTEIGDVATDYDDDYDALKNDLNLPENIEFGFRFEDEDEGVDILAEKTIPEDINVYTRDVFVLYEDNGDKLGGFLILKIW